MKALLFKDFFTLKKYMKTLLGILLILVILSVTLETNTYIIGYVAMTAFIVILASFSYDEYSKWDKYALTLPFSKKTIVKSKYVFSILLVLITIILSFAIISIIDIWKNTFNLVENLQTIAGTSLSTLLIISFVLPLIFKFGTQKSRLILTGLILIIIILVISLVPIISGIATLHFSNELIQILIYLSPLLFIFAMFISYSLSCKIYLNKDI